MDVKQPTFDFEQGSAKVEQPADARYPQQADPGSSPGPATTVQKTVQNEWHEVPQARFLSWSDDMQRAYCAARDDASALTARERGEDPEFYIKRAESYRCQTT